VLLSSSNINVGIVVNNGDDLGKGTAVNSGSSNAKNRGGIARARLDGDILDVDGLNNVSVAVRDRASGELEGSLDLAGSKDTVVLRAGSLGFEVDLDDNSSDISRGEKTIGGLVGEAAIRISSTILSGQETDNGGPSVGGELGLQDRANSDVRASLDGLKNGTLRARDGLDDKGQLRRVNIPTRQEDSFGRGKVGVVNTQVLIVDALTLRGTILRELVGGGGAHCGVNSGDGGENQPG
jgi:hypothetical protein